MQLFLLTSGGRRSLPAHSHFQPVWSPTLAKPAAKQNTGNSKQQDGNLVCSRGCNTVTVAQHCPSGSISGIQHRANDASVSDTGATVHLNIQKSFNGNFMFSNKGACNYDLKTKKCLAWRVVLRYSQILH